MAGYETPREIAAARIEDRAPRVRLESMVGSGALYSYKLRIAERDYGHDAPNGPVWLADGYETATTARHIRAIAMELQAHGYEPTDELSSVNGQTYRRWVKIARHGDPRAVWRFGSHGAIVLTA